MLKLLMKEYIKRDVFDDSSVFHFTGITLYSGFANLLEFIEPGCTKDVQDQRLVVNISTGTVDYFYVKDTKLCSVLLCIDNMYMKLRSNEGQTEDGT